MYLLEPNVNMCDAFRDFITKSLAGGGDLSAIAGSPALTAIYDTRGFEAWLRRVKANETLQSCAESKYDEPGYTFIVAERVKGNDGLSQDYVSQFSKLADDEYMVGLVTLADYVPATALPAPSANRRGRSDSAYLALSMLPVYRTTASYILAIQDVLTHIVCAGLPYKYVWCTAPEGADSEELYRALQKCNFQLEPRISQDALVVDLRVAQQLRSHIQEWNKEG